MESTDHDPAIVVPIIEWPAWLHVQQDSQFLKDRHPYLREPFPRSVLPHEIGIAYGLRCMVKLVDVLNATDLPAKNCAYALEVILDMCSTQEKKVQGIDYGLVPATLHFARHQKPLIRGLVSKVLGSLALVISGRESIIKSNGVPILALSLADPIAQVNEPAAEAFAALTLSKDGMSKISPFKELIMPILVRHVSGCNQDVTMRGAIASITVIGNLTTTDEGIMAALQAGAVRVIHASIRRNGSHWALLEACLRAMRHIAHLRAGKIAVLEEKGLDIVGEAFHSEFAMIRKFAVATLMGLTLDEDTKYDCIEEYGHDLAQLLDDEDPDVAFNACIAIRSASELPRSKRKIMPLLNDKNRILVFGHPPLEID